MAWLQTRERGPLVASGIVGAASPAEWEGAPGEVLSWDELFASTGLFGIEFGAEASVLQGMAVKLRGFMSPPMVADAAFFVLSRAPLPSCPFCDAGASWPDDIVVVHLRRAGADIDDPRREIEVAGMLDLGMANGPQLGLASSVRLTGAIWVTA